MAGSQSTKWQLQTFRFVQLALKTLKTRKQIIMFKELKTTVIWHFCYKKMLKDDSIIRISLTLFLFPLTNRRINFSM